MENRNWKSEILDDGKLYRCWISNKNGTFHLGCSHNVGDNKGCSHFCHLFSNVKLKYKEKI